jgi:hypothetical protein
MVEASFSGFSTRNPVWYGNSNSRHSDTAEGCCGTFWTAANGSVFYKVYMQ